MILNKLLRCNGNKTRQSMLLLDNNQLEGGEVTSSHRPSIDCVLFLRVLWAFSNPGALIVLISLHVLLQ